VKQVKAPTSVSREIGPQIETYKPGSGNVKPVKGQSSSTSNKVVRPSKTTPAKVQRVSSNTSTRAASGSRVNTNKAENVREKQKVPTMGSRAASGSRVNTNKAENVKEKQKAPTMGSRAASGSQVNTNKAENVKENQKAPTMGSRGNKGNIEAKEERSERSKEFDSQYCKGWVDGYMKAYSKISKERLALSDVPKCEMTGKCEGYECGYKAGMMKAELKTKR
jgi:hypothetical protein